MPIRYFVGQPLIIPGLEGVSGVLETKIISYGETLRSISRQNQIPEQFLQKLNKITSPSELYAGVGFVIPKIGRRPIHCFRPGSAWMQARACLNWLSGRVEIHGPYPIKIPWQGLGMEFQAKSCSEVRGRANSTAIGLPPAFQSVELRDAPFRQGGTAEITIQTDPATTLSGYLVDKPLQFFPGENGTQVALQGVHAMLPPGPYPLQLVATLPDGSTQSFEQNVLIRSGFYPDEILIVDPSYIDPAVTEPESEQVEAIVAEASPDKYWDGLFSSPAVFPDCFTSRYGNRRSYNNSDYIYFHTGVGFLRWRRSCQSRHQQMGSWYSPVH